MSELSRQSEHTRKEGNVLFNDALNIFFNLRLYGVRHVVKDHSDSEKGNKLTPLLGGYSFHISIKGSFICTIPQTDVTCHGLYYTSRRVLAETRNNSMGPREGSIQ